MAKDSADNWKNKYFASLEQLEGKERQLEQTESLMRLALSRLSLAAEGVDKGLDKQLDLLRTSIRGKLDALRLERQLEEISNTVIRLDQQRARHKAKQQTPAEILGALLEEIKFPPGMSRQVRDVRKKLDSKQESPGENLIHDVAALLASALAAAESLDRADQAAVSTDVKPAPGKGAVQASPAILSRDAAKPADAHAAVDVNLCVRIISEILDKLILPEGVHSRANEIRRNAARATGEDELRRLARDIAALMASDVPHSQAAGPAHGGAYQALYVPTHEVLIQLLDNIAFPSELSDRAEAIKDTLSEGVKQEDWPRLLGTIAELIAAMRLRLEAEKSEMEAFLRQLTDRLGELDRHLQGAEVHRKASYTRGRTLGEVMNAQVHGIETSVRAASSLDEMKTAIQSRLEQIRDHLEEHRKAEEENQSRLEQQLKTATTRLNDMEAETGALRSHLKAKQLQATLDPLTNIPNRLAYDERQKIEVARWKRYKTSLALMILDVDRFKLINDTYGHKAGDKALKLIAYVLKQTLRETDFIARYGGEEFVALISNSPVPDLHGIGEKLRKAIEASDFHHNSQKVPITISLGYSVFAGNDSAEDVFQRADDALYRAKAQGRNRCVGAEVSGND